MLPLRLTCLLSLTEYGTKSYITRIFQHFMRQQPLRTTQAVLYRVTQARTQRDAFNIVITRRQWVGHGTAGIFGTQTVLTFVDWLKIVLFCISIIDLETGTENCLYGAVV